MEDRAGVPVSAAGSSFWGDSIPEGLRDLRCTHSGWRCHSKTERSTPWSQKSAVTHGGEGSPGPIC